MLTVIGFEAYLCGCVVGVEGFRRICEAGSGLCRGFEGCVRAVMQTGRGFQQSVNGREQAP